MELKYGTDEVVRNDAEVLIVPLWNWNRNTSNLIPSLMGSNRTFMELKYVVVSGQDKDGKF